MRTSHQARTTPTPRPGRRHRARGARLAKNALPGAVLLAFLVAVWEVVGLSDNFLLPTVGQVLSQLTHHPMEFVDAGAVTLKESGVGLGCSFVVAVTLAIGMSRWAVVERAVMPVAVILNVTPVVSIAPGIAFAMGMSSMVPRYILAGIIVFFPMLINTLVGLRSADPEAVQYFETLDASTWETLAHLRLPSSLPYLFAAARICFPLSLVGGVVAEFSTSGQTGLGSVISANIVDYDPAQVYAAVLCLAFLGVAVSLLVYTAERRFLSWHPTTASGVRGL